MTDPQPSGKAFIIHPIFPDDASVPTPDEKLEEAVGLSAAIHLSVVGQRISNLRKVTPSTIFGKGSVNDISEEIEDSGADLVIINRDISPAQQRNLEKAWQVKVIDRTGLILEIFGERAATHEGRLQVELARLDYERSRLIRTWTHLERQRGGTGFLAGPGESQLEIDRRLLNGRISRIKKDLEKVKKTRNLHRQNRQAVPFPVIALVGYTNAGKSTLFNQLTGAKVFAKDLLFATLDPTMRAIRLPNSGKVILSDTVGFISDLPTQLIAAFRATLEEVEQAELILHIQDASSETAEEQAKAVEEILKNMDVPAPIFNVYNKIDLLSAEEQEALQNKCTGKEKMISISAQTGKNVNALLKNIEQALSKNKTLVKYDVASSNGKEIAWAHAHGHIVDITEDEGTTHLQVLYDAKNHQLLKKRIKI